MGSSWHKKNDLLAAVKREMRREMEEIRFLRTILQQSPMGGLTVVVKGEGHIPEKGPRIRDIIERIAEREEMYANMSKDGDQTKRDHQKLAEGMWRALEIMNNPYRFLTDDEQAGWDAAEGASEAIVHARAGGRPALGYGAMHGRVRRERGPADDQVCAHCGEQLPGKMDWAYDHEDSNEVLESAKGKYSLDIAHYKPLCCKCHAAFDERGYKNKDAPEEMISAPAPVLPGGKQGPTLAQVKAAQQNKSTVVTRRKKD